ncbi:MAG: hypothetical protein ACTSRE_16270 [Promethearchaeota archaeon]
MKKSSLMSLVFLFIILGCLCINPVLAGTPDVTPQGNWGMSPGDELHYDVSTDESGSWVNFSAVITITDIIYDKNDVLWATIYNETGSSWILYPGDEFSHYDNDTFWWFGGYQVSLGMPIPAPIPFNLTMVNESICWGANATGWGSFTSSQVGSDTLIYSNGSVSLEVTYDTDNGICTENIISGASSSWAFDCQCPWIPGYSPLIILTSIIVSLATLTYAVQRKKKL